MAAAGHKRSVRQEQLASRLARSGHVVAAIDGPFHGDRVERPLSADVYQRLMVQRELRTPRRVLNDASRVVAPVLYHVPWDDEIFGRDGQLAVFDALGSPDKRLVAFPGPHAGVTEPMRSAWCQFLDEHLTNGSRGT